jgi:hypothetical protein
MGNYLIVLLPGGEKIERKVKQNVRKKKEDEKCLPLEGKTTPARAQASNSLRPRFL